MFNTNTKSRLLTLLALLIIPIMLTSCPPTPKPADGDKTTPTAPDGAETPDDTDMDETGMGDTRYSAEELQSAKDDLNKILGDLYFDYNRSNLRTISKSVLTSAAPILKKYRTLKVTVEGHCDNRGTVEYNIALGERRSNAVKRYLKNLGVSSSQIKTISYGEEKPQCTDDTESCWQKNRRAHFKIR